jgi:hypothetical protein
MVCPPIIFDTPACLTVREVAARARRAYTSSGSRGLLAVEAVGRLASRGVTTTLVAPSLRIGLEITD